MFNIAGKARRYFGAVLLTMILLTAGGVYSYFQMPSSIYPEVTFPRIAVVARVPGLALANMEIQVTQPLEQAASTVWGVTQVRSKTIRGASEFSIDFDPGTDMLRAEQQTWNRIGAIRSQLPPNVELTVEQMTPSVFPIMSVVLTGGESSAKLRDYAFYDLAPRLKTIPDVLYANVAGGDIREIEVEARPEALLAAGLSAADLADQIGQVHRLQPVGRIERPPFAFQIMVYNQAEAVRQVDDLVISTKGNQPLKVKDLARVRALHQDRTMSVGYEGKDAVVITVFRRVGGNTVNVSQAVRDLLAKQQVPRNVRATVVYDQATFINTAVDNVRDAILIGGLFSILILLAFLRSWRATLISALALPTTLAITFLFLRWTGETLNLMSLGGLAVAIGLIIDDTVVVVENIARHLMHRKKLGKPHPTDNPEQAAAIMEGVARKAGAGAPAAGAPVTPAPSAPAVPPEHPVDAASGEITGAVVGSTLTTVLVFVPLAFIVGVYGQFFASLSRALAISVLVSMVISLTLIPVLAAAFLGKKPMPEPGRIYRFFEHGYEMLLNLALRFPWVTMTLSVAAVLLGVVLYTGVPNFWAEAEEGKTPLQLVKKLQTGLLPEMDEGAFVVDFFAAAGTPLEDTERMVKQIEGILSENPDVDAYVRRAGAELGLFATQTDRGDIQVVLRPAEEDPWHLLTKPVRPEFTEIEDKMKEVGTERARQKFGPRFTEEQMWAEGKAYIRENYRRRPVAKITDEIRHEIGEHFTEHQMKVDLIQILKDELDDLSGANKPLEVKIFGPDQQKLRELAEEVEKELKKQGKGHGLKDVDPGVTAGNPDMRLIVDESVASRMGLTVQEVERQLKAIYQGQIATQVKESDARITDVRVRYPDALRFGPGLFRPGSVLEQWILLPEGKGAKGFWNPGVLKGPTRAVQLGSVARINVVRTHEKHWRENQQPVVIVTADQNEEEAGLDQIAADVQEWMKAIHLPDTSYRWELGGHYLKEQTAFRSLLVVMVVAILLVYIMLAFQFRSLVLPLLIFLTQPLSIVSGLFALWVTGTPLNVSSYMGAILLIGLDMKNGILLVEYIQHLLGEGKGLHEALIVAGRTRFRPILMTSLAAILGLLPLALGIGPGAQMQRPLAIMVIGGLTANMLFTRLIIPVGYLIVRGKQRVQPAAAK